MVVKRRWFSLVLAVLIVIGGLLPALQPATVRAEPFADPAFNSLWSVTDSLVANGAVKRTWFWGPTPGFISHERYDQAPNGSRLVQYFEKGRMEINNPNGDRTSPFFVTGGLLVLDMVTGNQQVGDNSYISRTPSTQIVAGDGGDASAPTYTSFRSVSSLTLNTNRIPANLNGFATSVLAVDGTVSTNASKASDPQAQIVAYSDIFGHNIPRAMWDFMNARGPIVQGGTVVQNQPIINWVFTLGYPISDAYWAHVHIAGQPADVLIQLFQRRTLVYAPSLPAGFRLQMGNVGSHYYNWLYTSNFACPTGLNCNGAQPTATPTAAPAPSLPANIDASISPSSGPAGTRFTINVTKMSAGENVAAWTTRLRDNVVTPLPDPSQTADGNGNISGLTVDSAGFSDGVYAVTYYGRTSKHSSVAYFAIGAAAPTNTPTPPAPGPTNTPGPSGATVSITPAVGDVNTTFTISASGFQANERVGIWFTSPSQQAFYPQNGTTFYADNAGNFSYQFKPADAFTILTGGVWAFTIQGVSSGKQAITHFTLNR